MLNLTFYAILLLYIKKFFYCLKVMNSCLFIYNPISGKGKVEKNKSYIQKKLAETFEAVTLHATSYSGELTDKILKDANKYKTIIIAGGDGTFNEMVNAVARLQDKPNIGYIPTGTVNDIARSVGISSSIKKAVKTVCTGNVEYLDCMKIQDKYAMYVVATGAYTHTAYATPQKTKKRLGKFAYAIEAFKTNINFQTFAIEAERTRNIKESNIQNLQTENENTTFKADTMQDTAASQETDTITNTYVMHSVFVIIMNGKYVAGRKVNTKSSMKDGEIELVIIKQVEKPNFWHKIAAFFRLIHFFIWGHYALDENIHKFKGKMFTIKTLDDVVWSYDGEKGENGTIHVEVQPQSIPLIVPTKSKKI